MNEETIRFIRNAAKEKSDDLSDFFEEVKQSVADESIGLTLNTLFLANACESYFIDMERHKDFHRLDIADRHKRASFLFKWLSKIRPVNLCSYKRGSGEGKALQINAYFALSCALGEVNVDVEKLAKSTSIFQHIIYTSAYREINAETWALNFCLLEMQFPGNIQ